MRLFILDDDGRVVLDSDDMPEVWRPLLEEDRTRVLTLINTVLRLLLKIK